MRASSATLSVMRRELEQKETEAAETRIKVHTWTSGSKSRTLIKSLLQLDAFVRDVGRAVDAADIHDAELVLSAVKEAVRARKAAHPPHNPPSSHTTIRGRRAHSSRLEPMLAISRRLMLAWLQTHHRSCPSTTTMTIRRSKRSWQLPSRQVSK